MITGLFGFVLNAFSIIVLSAVAVIALISLAFYFRSIRSEEHTSELQSHHDLVCRLLLEKKKTLRTNTN